MGIFDKIFGKKSKDLKVRDVRKLVEEEDVEGLIKTLRDEYPRRGRWEVVEALGKIGDARAVEPLIQALRDEDSYVRWETATALGEIGDAKAVEPLIQALKDKDPRRGRREAVEALGKIGDAKAVEPLIQALKDEDLWVQKRTSESLGKIGDKRAADAVINWLFKRPRVIKLRDDYGARDEDEISKNLFDNLFGDYTRYILDAASYYLSVCEYYDHSGYECKYSLTENETAVKKLCGINTPISSNILYKVARLQGKKVTGGWGAGHSWDTSLSFVSSVKMAKEELNRRGNPPYHPDAYFEEGAWKL